MADNGQLPVHRDQRGRVFLKPEVKGELNSGSELDFLAFFFLFRSVDLVNLTYIMT